jgi:hypothetical protein
MYWKIQSNTTYIDYVMIRLHVSTMKQSSSGLSNNYLKIKLHSTCAHLGSQYYRRYELQYGVVTIDITIFLFYFLGILDKVRHVFLEYCAPVSNIGKV